MTRFIPTLLALLLVTAPATGRAGEPELAIRGYDAVAFFTENAARKGDPSFAAIHDGKTYHFVSAGNRDLFAADPAKYLPQYDGYCALGVSAGVRKRTDPTAFAVKDERLYLQYSKDALEVWQQDPDSYIDRADENWAGMQQEPASPASP